MLMLSAVSPWVQVTCSNVLVGSFLSMLSRFPLLHGQVTPTHVLKQLFLFLSIPCQEVR